MKRVEIDMDESFRGLVSEYSEINDVGMPTAYRELLEHGIIRSDVRIEPRLGEQLFKKVDFEETETQKDEN